jgi:tripartite ATP-independent transporter DctP family solute receptor
MGANTSRLAPFCHPVRTIVAFDPAVAIAIKPVQRKKMRLLTKFISVTAIAGLMLVLGATPHALALTPVKVSHSAAENFDNDMHMSAWVFHNYIKTHSDTLDSKLYPARALGEERAVVEGMTLGSGASVFIGAAAILGNFSPKIGLLGLPYLWNDYGQIHKVLDGPVGDALASELEKSGFKVLAWTDNWGYRNVITKKEIRKPEDLKGLKIRTIQTPVFLAAVNAMGAAATPMAFGEVYTGLQTGVIDGFEYQFAGLLSEKLYEVAKYGTLTRHIFAPTIIVYSKKEWDRLTDNEKKVVMDAAKLAQTINRAVAPIKEAEAAEQLKAKGMTINAVDTAPFRKNAIQVQDKFAKDLGATDLLNAIRNTK